MPHRLFPTDPRFAMIHERFARHGVKIRFVLVGVWNTFFGYGVYVALDWLFERLFASRAAAYMSAAVLSNILAILNAYIFHKFITFRSEARGWAMVPELFRFFSTYLVSIVVGLVSLPVFVEVFRIDPKIAGALVMPVTVLVSWLGHSRFSFRNEKTKT
ncbi:MAG TPA: GtrA family protein [Syntrophales bacterium]|nr:GtrA family protein [Syntrophales bacterium]